MTVLRPIFAQNLLEYGMLGSLVESLHVAFYHVRDWVYQSPGEAWLVVVVLAVLFLLVGRRSR